MIKRLLALAFFTAAVGLAACSPAASTAPSFGTTETLPVASPTSSDLPLTSP
ncbi:MAG TPA: hypothetical protein VF484_03925 [Candidatus Limnocylindrales bacterium]